MKPTVLLAEAGSTIELEEVCGPVLTVVPCDGGKEEALRLGNGNGLLGAVWGSEESTTVMSLQL